MKTLNIAIYLAIAIAEDDLNILKDDSIISQTESFLLDNDIAKIIPTRNIIHTICDITKVHQPCVVCEVERFINEKTPLDELKENITLFSADIDVKLAALQCYKKYSYQYLADGTQNAAKYLQHKSIQKHIDLMTLLYNSLPDENKPKWLSIPIIKELHSLMINFIPYK
ncbi:MAG: LPD11 domain-containing protein [Clostridia bacterium]